jgi:hypothetical protein
MSKRQRIKQSRILDSGLVTTFGVVYPGVGDFEVWKWEVFV